MSATSVRCFANGRLLAGLGRVGARGVLKRLKAVGVDPGDERSVVFAHDVPRDHHVHAVNVHVLQDARVVRDNDEGAVAALAIEVHGRAKPR